MGTFEATPARQRLGVTPTTAVRANIDTRTGAGAVGQAIGQGLLGVGVAAIELFKRKQAMEDTLASGDASKIMIDAEARIEKFREDNPDTRLWSGNQTSEMKGALSTIENIESSSDHKAILNQRASLWASKKGASFLAAEMKQKESDTLKVIVDDLIEAEKSGDIELKIQANDRFDEQIKSIQSPDVARITKATAIKAGQEGRGQDLVNSVHAAMQAGDLATATVLADNPNIPEKIQTGLRRQIENKQKEMVEAAKNLTADAFFIELNEGTLTVPRVLQAVKQGILDRTVGQGYINAINNGNFVVTDPVVKANFILETSDFEQGKGNFRNIADKIQAAMGTTLHHTDSEQLLIRLTSARDTPNAKVNVREKFFRARAKDLYTKDVFGSREKESQEAAVNFFNVDERLRQFAIDKPEATQKQWEEEWLAATSDQTGRGIFGKILDIIIFTSPLEFLPNIVRKLQQRDRAASKTIDDIISQGRDINISPPNKLKYEIGETVVSKDGVLVRKISEGVWQPVQDF